MSRFSHTREKTAHARTLRRATTKSEWRLWSYLRGSTLGASFRRQHPIGPYFADFCCPSLKIVVELDGGHHAERAAYDARRTRYLNEQGYLVVRYWNNQITEELDGVCADLMDVIRRRRFELSTDGADPL